MRVVISKIDIRKAERRGSREAAMENATGWVRTCNGIHKNPKVYNRKVKHKNNGSVAE